MFEIHICTQRVSLLSTLHIDDEAYIVCWSCHSTEECHDARLLQVVVDILQDAKP